MHMCIYNMHVIETGNNNAWGQSRKFLDIHWEPLILKHIMMTM